jgi:Protein of unknown function (DUF3800)
MHLYLDESGDTGFEFRRGSSRYFVVAIVVAPDPDALVEALENQRIALRKPHPFEFKFARLDHEERLKILRVLAAEDWTARVLVVNKQRLQAPGIRSRDGFFKYLIGTALTIDFDDIVQARLVVDQAFKSKAKQADLATYIMRGLNAEAAARVKRIKGIVYQESHRAPMLQVADLVAGAVARSYERGDGQYRIIITRKITVLEMP